MRHSSIQNSACHSFFLSIPIVKPITDMELPTAASPEPYSCRNRLMPSQATTNKLITYSRTSLVISSKIRLTHRIRLDDRLSRVRDTRYEMVLAYISHCGWPHIILTQQARAQAFRKSCRMPVSLDNCKNR